MASDECGATCICGFEAAVVGSSICDASARVSGDMCVGTGGKCPALREVCKGYEDEWFPIM